MKRVTASALGLLLLSGAAMLPSVASAQDYGSRYDRDGDRYGRDAFERGYRLGRADERRYRGPYRYNRGGYYPGYRRDTSRDRDYGLFDDEREIQLDD